MLDDGDPPEQSELTSDPPAPTPGADDVTPAVPEPVVWWRAYVQEDVPRDLIAGALVAVLLIPQAFAYAQLANLPPTVGIAAALVAPVVYAIFGGSRYLAIGPVALVSLLVGDAVGSFGGDQHAMAMAIALLAGLVLVAMGGLRLGFVFRAFTPPVLTGFIFAAALVIATSQVGALLGIDLPRGEPAVALWGQVVSRLGDANLAVVAVGGGALVALFVVPAVLRRAWRLDEDEGDGGWRGHVVRAVPLAVLLAAAGAVAVGGLEARGVATLGRVDLPSLVPTLPTFEQVELGQILVAAGTVALVGAVTTLAIAKTLAARFGGEVTSSRELFSLGLANMATSVTGGYPVGGSLSRSAVVANTGGRSPLGAVFGALLLAGAAVALAPVLAAIPVAALSALIMKAAIGMLDVASAREAWVHDRGVLAFMVVPFLGVLVGGIQVGLGVTLAAGIAHLSLQHLSPARSLAD